ncbi:hypothetical protein R3P38DRAFT_2770574 [Favolaschia claudopus]|uniref:Uncharacterized protein n=1 Tax=Favolaschia claudopus TaxID=2862362 RepID=A0AAW0CI42_9AGAR
MESSAYLFIEFDSEKEFHQIKKKKLAFAAVIVDSFPNCLCTIIGKGSDLVLETWYSSDGVTDLQSCSNCELEAPRCKRMLNLQALERSTVHGTGDQSCDVEGTSSRENFITATRRTHCARSVRIICGLVQLNDERTSRDPELPKEKWLPSDPENILDIHKAIIFSYSSPWLWARLQDLREIYAKTSNRIERFDSGCLERNEANLLKEKNHMWVGRQWDAVYVQMKPEEFEKDQASLDEHEFQRAVRLFVGLSRIVDLEVADSLQGELTASSAPKPGCPSETVRGCFDRMNLTSLGPGLDPTHIWLESSGTTGHGRPRDVSRRRLLSPTTAPDHTLARAPNANRQSSTTDAQTAYRFCFTSKFAGSLDFDGRRDLRPVRSLGARVIYAAALSRNYSRYQEYYVTAPWSGASRKNSGVGLGLGPRPQLIYVEQLKNHPTTIFALWRNIALDKNTALCSRSFQFSFVRVASTFQLSQPCALKATSGKFGLGDRESRLQIAGVARDLPIDIHDLDSLRTPGPTRIELLLLQSKLVDSDISLPLDGLDLDLLLIRRSVGLRRLACRVTASIFNIRDKITIEDEESAHFYEAIDGT